MMREKDQAIERLLISYGFDKTPCKDVVFYNKTTGDSYVRLAHDIDGGWRLYIEVEDGCWMFESDTDPSIAMVTGAAAGLLRKKDDDPFFHEAKPVELQTKIFNSL